MKLTLTNAMVILNDVIAKNKTHKDYDRVVKMADTLNKLGTGMNMDSLMRRFNRRENEEAFNQRKDITQHITKTVFRNLMKPTYKIPRSNGLQRILVYEDDNENQKIRKFEEIISRFWGDMSVEAYLSKPWIDKNYYDPNAFVVFEWGAFDDQRERPKVYPFEVGSKEAIYPYFKNNVLQFLIVKNYMMPTVGKLLKRVDVKYAEGRAKVPPKESVENYPRRYTMYLQDRTIVLDEILNTKKREEVRREAVTISKFTENSEVLRIGNDLFLVTLPTPHNLNKVPAYRVGFEYDAYTENRTCISPIDEAVPILMKMVKANSEMDLTMALHAFPQKIQYKTACQTVGCREGKMPDGGVCGKCKGSGLEIHTSTQDIIEMKLPKDAEDIFDLSKLIHYERPPVDLVKFQDEYIKSLTRQCKEAIYNSEIFSKQEISETATGKNIDLQNVYDALYPFAQAYAEKWEFSMVMIAKITKTNEGLIARLIFSRDFKMKSLSDLYADLKQISDSRADSFVKESIQDDIARIMYADNDFLYKRFRTQKAFFPYSGKSREEIIVIINTVPKLDFNKILWESYGWIFTEIEIEQTKENKNFYDFNRSKQYTIITKKVKKIIKEREEEMELIPALNGDGQGDTED